MPPCPRCGEEVRSDKEWVALRLIDEEGRTIEEAQAHVKCFASDFREALGR